MGKEELKFRVYVMGHVRLIDVNLPREEMEAILAVRRITINEILRTAFAKLMLLRDLNVGQCTVTLADVEEFRTWKNGEPRIGS